MISRIVVFLIIACSSAAGQLPRYTLATGDHLVFERKVQVTPAVGEPRRYTEQVQLYILERVREEWLVLLEAARVRGNELEPSYGCVFHVDPRGVARFAPETISALESNAPADAPWLGDPMILADMFRALPAALDNPSAWSSAPDSFGRVVRATAAAAQREPAAALACFGYTCSDSTGVMETLRQTQRGTFCFDGDQGLLTTIESFWSDPGGQYRATTTLFRKTTQPPEWLKRERAEMSRYLGALRLEAGILDESLTRPDRSVAVEQRVRRAWQELVDASRGGDSVFRELARGRLARLADDLPRITERGRIASEWLARPAAQWSLQNLAGETIRSEDVRDRTTVEFFWSASSAPSLRMFAALRALRSAIDEESLRIVCLNIDTDVVLARAAAERLGAPFLHVFSGPPLRGDAPLELPIIRVLDRRSQVLRIAIGTRDDLLEVVKPHAP